MVIPNNRAKNIFICSPRLLFLAMLAASLLGPGVRVGGGPAGYRGILSPAASRFGDEEGYPPTQPVGFHARLYQRDGL